MNAQVAPLRRFSFCGHRPPLQKNKDLRWRGRQLGSLSLGGFGFSALHAV
jgi:hypothetical protein